MTLNAGVIAENYQNYGLNSKRGNGLTAACKAKLAVYTNNDKHFIPGKRIGGPGSGATFGATAGDFGKPVDVLTNRIITRPGVYWLAFNVSQDTPQSLGKVNFKMMNAEHVRPILGQNESIPQLSRACFCLATSDFPARISDDRGITGGIVELKGTDTAAAPLIYIKPTSFDAVEAS